jgi:hypothetical protein
MQVTVEYPDFTLLLEGDYTVGEPEVLYPVDDAYPGSADTFELKNIEILKGSILDLLYSGKGPYDLEQDALDNI